jgi:multidrug efflux pump subunit AcrB
MEEQSSSGLKGAIEHFVKYPLLANIFIVLTLLGGIVAFLNTKKSFFPTQKDRTINIQVAYPGASPEEMEDGVTIKIEEAIKSIAGIDEIVSTSSENSANINVLTLDNYNIDDIYTEIKNAVDGINSFPVSAEKPVVFKQRQRSTAQWLALTGDVSLVTLKRYAEQIEDELLASGNVSQIGISGFNPVEISVEVSEQTLSRYGLTFDQVADAVRQNNRDISAGSVKSTEEEILIRSNAKEVDADRLGEIILRANPDGTNLFLRDVAGIREQFEDQPFKAKLNGHEAVFIEVRKLEEEDLEQISSYVDQYVKDFNEKHPGLKLHVTWDFMGMLQQRLDLLKSNGLTGLFFVCVALGLFLSMRLSFWVAFGIPAAFLGMLVIGMFFGLTINMMSLFGMILVIGILVDDGIVIAENVYTHFEKHGNPIKAAVDGTMEVLSAVFTSVLTTIVAFTPILLLSGGFEFLKDMAFVVIASLAFSLIEAAFILPAHLASRKVLSVKKENTRSHKIRKTITNGINFLRFNIYGKALRFTLEYRFISICFLFALFPITIGLFSGGFIKATFFPQIPFTNFNVNVAFKPGTRENVVEDYLQKFDNAVWQVNADLKKELKTDTDIVNYTFSSIGNTGDGTDRGSHAGNINVFYKELDEFGLNQFDLINKVQTKIGRVPEAEKFNVGGAQRWGKPISVRVMGKDYEQLQHAKEDLKKELGEITALKDIQDNVAIGRREMNLQLNPQAYFLGLNHNEITKQIRQGFFGEEVQRLQKGKDEVRVWVRYPNSGRLNIGQVENIKIKSQQGEEFPLNQLASYSIDRGVTSIRHYNANREVSVEADLVDPFGEVPPIMKEVQDNIVPKLLAKYPGIKIDYGGQSQQSAKAQKEIGLFFLGALILMLVIIMINFKSFYQGFIIILMVPLGWLGACWGHGLEGFPVSLLSVWGMVALSGVVINDAVVFLDKFNSLIKHERLTVKEAAYEAGVARFRAIMLTSLTTVAGLYPLILEKSFQAQFLIPMAISVAYGVFFSTFITLLFLPVIIMAFNDVRVYIKWFGGYLSYFWEPYESYVNESGELVRVSRKPQRPTREEVERVLVDEKRLAEYHESK